MKKVFEEQSEVLIKTVTDKKVTKEGNWKD